MPVFPKKLFLRIDQDKGESHFVVKVDPLYLTGINETLHSDGSITFSKEHVGQSFDNWDLFQVGGIIFF